ncbi:SDR family NAD(P)-dependent oxidoreductase [Brevibacterium marinum]|uniref:NAD(P)-dependent dehydrogenase (Short-subunit alcohol dehydrogenase family) n=1 Tax=Brevibacterium marinum TaxID=418643 RepID=A0A846RXA5_9MICO|nr:SDR family NAD(P)-dependent oxidoreductase [Brevibacterium marinum]NJC55263.1 NAD(P)-dependent dehydrogenase (short-subunit alcohol dehydrogenase family) [Brevibacterium marinum]
MNTETTATAPTESTPVALVSGANRGIGLQVATDLAAAGFTVLLGSRSKESGRRAAAEIGAGTVALHLDVTDDASITAAADRIETEFGRLDLLVNNAGVSFLGDRDTPLQERARSGLLTTAPLSTVRDMYEINVFGVIALTQALLPLLRSTPGSRVVNVGSGGGSLAANADPQNPHRQMFGLYSVTKTALHAVSLAFATALEPEGIPVNTVDPGMTATALNDFQGTRTVEQGAAHIVAVALRGRQGPTGTFTSDEGTVPW